MKTELKEVRKSEVKEERKREAKEAVKKHSLLQIAPTIAEIFSIPLKADAKSLEEVLNFVHKSGKRWNFRVILLVIDSLDWQFFKDFAYSLRRMHALASSGLLFKCETVSEHTTPAIASILTGLRPESHGILTENDVGKSGVDSILEILDAHGIKTAAVLEERGAKPLKGKISFVFPVRDREDILDYDEEVKEKTLLALKKASMIFAHFRAIDRFAHRSLDMREAARFTDENVGEIVNAVAADAARGVETLFFLCGDHRTHGGMREEGGGRGKREDSVPLIFCIFA